MILILTKLNLETETEAGIAMSHNIILKVLLAEKKIWQTLVKSVTTC